MFIRVDKSYKKNNLIITWAIQTILLEIESKKKRTICQMLICLSYAKQSNTIFVIYDCSLYMPKFMVQGEGSERLRVSKQYK